MSLCATKRDSPSFSSSGVGRPFVRGDFCPRRVLLTMVEGVRYSFKNSTGCVFGKWNVDTPGGFVPSEAVVVRDTDVTTQRKVMEQLGSVPFARRGQITKSSSRCLVP